MQDKLDIKNKTRSNLLKWNAQFSPELIEHFLEEYAQVGYTVLDPFLGSGTVLVECARLQLKSIGVELNPAAVKLASIYKLCKLGQTQKEELIQMLEPAIKKNSKSINSLKVLIKNGEHDEFTSATVDAFITLLDIDAKSELDQEKVQRTWAKLQKVILSLPHTDQTLDVFNADARSIPIKSSSIDLVITSPPYINVFNYHQQYRGSMELLGYDILNIAKSEIGANRKNRSNRFKTVISYCYEIADVLKELCRVTKPGARIIFVVGRQSNVLGVPFYNGDIVAKIADELTCLTTTLRQERKFKNKFGQLIYEDILHFENSQNTNVSKATLNNIVEDVLFKGLQCTKKEDTKKLINEAIKYIPAFEQEYSRKD